LKHQLNTLKVNIKISLELKLVESCPAGESGPVVLLPDFLQLIYGYAAVYAFAFFHLLRK
jgi:hypothetical protein